ncbi:MAG: hypothetical protein AAF773_08215 [Cyanobacteria bacterium P01_D01_bin.115]
MDRIAGGWHVWQHLAGSGRHPLWEGQVLDGAQRDDLRPDPVAGAGG